LVHLNLAFCLKALMQLMSVDQMFSLLEASLHQFKRAVEHERSF